MFDQLMSILQRGGTLTIDQMARELDTTPAMVIELIDHLARAGRLKPLGVKCDSSCGECVLASDGCRAHQGRVWQITG